jgi:hypothetical protein
MFDRTIEAVGGEADNHPCAEAVRASIVRERTSLGIELGSTRIKACLVGENPSVVLAIGSHE